MKSRLLLNIVIRKRTAILQLLPCEDQTLLIRWNAFLVLNLRLHIWDCVRGFNIQGNGLASKCLDKYLHASSQSKHKMKSRLLLDIVVRKGTAILQLFSSKNQTLLIRWNTFLVLNLGLDIGDSIWGLDIQCDSLASKSFDKDLHTSSQSENQMKSRLLLNIVIRKRTAILQLLPCEDQTLLIRWNAFLVLNLRLHIWDCVRGFNIQGNGLASKCLDKYLHASSQSKHKMKSRLLLDIVVRKGTAILQLFSSKNQTLLIRWNTFLVLNLGLDIGHSIWGLDIQCYRLPGECLDKDLHASP